MHAKRLGLSEVECIGAIDCASSLPRCYPGAVLALSWLQAVSPCAHLAAAAASFVPRRRMSPPLYTAGDLRVRSEQALSGSCDQNSGRCDCVDSIGDARGERGRVGGCGRQLRRNALRCAARPVGYCASCLSQTRAHASSSSSPAASCACLHGARTSRAHPLASARAPGFFRRASKLTFGVGLSRPCCSNTSSSSLVARGGALRHFRCISVHLVSMATGP